MYTFLIQSSDLAIHLRNFPLGIISASVLDCLIEKIPTILCKKLLTSHDLQQFTDIIPTIDTEQITDWKPIGRFKWSSHINELLWKYCQQLRSTPPNLAPIHQELQQRYQQYPTKLAELLQITTVKNPRLAILSPYPPEPSGIADYTFMTIKQLVTKYPNLVIDVFCQNPHKGPYIENVSLFTYEKFVERRQINNYTNILYVFGNSQYHLAIYHLFKQYPGVCLLHDPTLHCLYEDHLRKPLPDPRGLSELMEASTVIVHSKHIIDYLQQYGPKSHIYYIPFQPIYRESSGTLPAFNIGGLHKWLICCNGHLNHLKYPGQILAFIAYLKNKKQEPLLLLTSNVNFNA